MIRSMKIMCAFALMLFIEQIAAEEKPAKTIDESLHILELTVVEQKPLSGPNQEVYLANCVTCHTTRYVSMQPVLSEKKWGDEVTKMVKVFGAPIPEEQAAQIVKYLVAVNTNKK